MPNFVGLRLKRIKNVVIYPVLDIFGLILDNACVMQTYMCAAFTRNRLACFLQGLLST